MGEEKDFDLICMGNLNFDVTMVVDGFPDFHEKVFADEMELGLGGAAGNTAAWSSSLGLDVGFIGAVGKDWIGDEHIKKAKKFGIDTEGIKEVKGHSGLAAIFSSGQDKRMIKYTGANSEKRIDPEYVRRSRHIHMTSNSLKDIRKIIDICESENTTISLDPSGIEIPKDIEENIDFLIMNQNEANRLANSDDNESELENIIDEFGSRNTIIMLNKGGAIIDLEGEDLTTVSSYDIEAVDTTGAGDSFVSGLLYGVLKNYNPKLMGKIGVACASFCVQEIGARSAVCNRDKIKEFLEKKEEGPLEF